MSVMSIITNCVHIAFTSKQLEYYLPFVANQNKIVLFFVFEVSGALQCAVTSGLEEAGCGRVAFASPCSSVRHPAQTHPTQPHHHTHLDF